MMGRSPRCYISSFVEIGPLVPEKKIFEGFLRHLGPFRSPYPRRLHIKFGLDWSSDFGEDDVLSLWTTTYGRTDAGLCDYFKLTYEPLAQVSLKSSWDIDVF